MLSRDAASGVTEYRAVKETFQTPAKPLYGLTLRHADGTSEHLTLTGDHPFRVLGEAANDPAWVNSGDLQSGQQVETQAGTAEVVELKALNRQAVTYNIEVEGNHTYFVGQQPTLVHNCSCKVAGSAADAARGASRGGESAAAAAGRRAHSNYGTALGEKFDTKVTLPSGKKPDAVDWENREVRELKPDNARAVARGERQVEGYKQELENVTGETWTSVIDVYRAGK